MLPDNTFINLGKAALGAGQYERAYTLFSSAIQQEPRHPPCYLYRAKSSMGIRAYPAAEEDLSEVISLTEPLPRILRGRDLQPALWSTEAHEELGSIYSAARFRPLDAVGHFCHAIANLWQLLPLLGETIEGVFGRIHYQRAMVGQDHLQRYDRALEDWDRGITSFRSVAGGEDAWSEHVQDGCIQRWRLQRLLGLIEHDSGSYDYEEVLGHAGVGEGSLLCGQALFTVDLIRAEELFWQGLRYTRKYEENNLPLRRRLALGLETVRRGYGIQQNN